MGNFKSMLIRTLIALFTFFFIYPAIVFACLMLAFTSSWKTGLFMLVSALLLRYILKREAVESRKLFRKRRGKMTSRSLRLFSSSYDKQASLPKPPRLSDIYDEITAGIREQEAILTLLTQQDQTPEGKGSP